MSARMDIELIGPHPLGRDTQGQLLTRIGTLFTDRRVLYTKPPGVHAWQRCAYIQILNAQRAEQGLPPLSSEDEESLCANSVDLVFDADQVLIRPDPARLSIALAADELLQTLVSKRQVKFLGLSDARVREVIKTRGEYWRLSSLPKTREGKKRLIFGSKVAINGLPIYYYNRLTGTRWLTFQEFESLGQLDPVSLAQHLQEIAEYASRTNRYERPEVNFFAAELRSFGPAEFSGPAFTELSPAQLATRFTALKESFRSAIHDAYRRDDITDRSWSERMLSTLFLDGCDTQTENVLSELSPEFFLQIEWLPGGRFEEGEFLVDPIFDEAAAHPDNADLQRLCDPRAKEIILNFTRDYLDLDYINLGCVPESLSLDRPQKEGRRAVYLVEFRVHRQATPVRRFLRLQKWSVWEHLDEGMDLLASIQESDEYSDYLQDRRLGCRQLGMNLSRRTVMRRLTEVYLGETQRYRGQVIRTPYYEREYVPGIATDKLPLDRYTRPGYAHELARLLGTAAASSLIVGRSLEGARPAFDDGDEVVIENELGLPIDILVADHSGAFTEYDLALEKFAAEYARPVNRRNTLVPDAAEFAETYLAALQARFAHIQSDYRKRRRAFDTLFKGRKYDPAGSFAYRWECVLRRLDQTDDSGITNAVRSHIHSTRGTH
jgi:hypothetical protein